MALAFARHMSPETPYLLAAVLSGRRRPRHLPRGHVLIKIADRLAVGLPPEAATLPEGDPGLAGRLLEQEDFRALVEASRELLDEPEDAQRRGLIILARQTLERVLALDDAGAAVFVLEEEAHGRDPAVTLAEGVRASQARARRPIAPPPPVPAGRRHIGPGYAPGYDPLRALMQRGSARLRTEVRVEDALRRAAVAACPTALPTAELAADRVAATRAAAADAFCLVRAASPPGALDPVEAQPHTGAHGPRQPRAP